MNDHDIKKAIEAVKNLLDELNRNYQNWNSQSLEHFRSRVSQILSNLGIPKSMLKAFVMQSVPGNTPSYVINKTYLVGCETMTMSMDSKMPGSDNLIEKIECFSDTLSEIQSSLNVELLKILSENRDVEN